VETETAEKIAKGVKFAATLGGPMRFKKENKWMYFGERGTMSRERLFGMRGPIHFGMPHKEAMAVEALHSDTKSDLIRELTNSGLTRDEAERTVNGLIRRGILVEVNDPDLGKILIFGR